MTDTPKNIDRKILTLSPSFQEWNYKNNTFSDPNAVKIVKIV